MLRGRFGSEDWGRGLSHDRPSDGRSKNQGNEMKTPVGKCAG